MPQEISLPDDILTGRCPSCKSVIEILRKDARPPDNATILRGHRDTFSQMTGELWSTECPVCISHGVRVTDQDGQISHPAKGGARVFLVRKV